MILDDVHISADEKHHFKGLGKKKELILDEAHLSIVIGDLKGIPMPEELKVYFTITTLYILLLKTNKFFTGLVIYSTVRIIQISESKCYPGVGVPT